MVSAFREERISLMIWNLQEHIIHILYALRSYSYALGRWFPPHEISNEISQSGTELFQSQNFHNEQINGSDNADSDGECCAFEKSSPPPFIISSVNLLKRLYSYFNMLKIIFYLM